MFRDMVDRTLATILKLLLQTQTSSLEIFTCLGRVLSALITTVGPELQQLEDQEIAAGMLLINAFYHIFFSFFPFFQSVLLSCAPAPCCRAIPTL